MDISQRQSSEIGELVKAKTAAKKEYKPFRADTKGQYGEYGSMDAVKEATEEALIAHGLDFEQGPIFIDGRIMLESSLSHSSGQWKKWYMPLDIPDAPRDIDQAKGRAYTYQRRYAAYGILGLGKGDGNEDPDMQQPESINDKQLWLLKNLLKSQPEREAKLCAYYKLSSLAQLPKQFMNEVVEALKPKE